MHVRSLSERGLPPAIPWPPTPTARRTRRASRRARPVFTPALTPTRSPSRATISMNRRAKRSPPICTNTYGRPASIRTAAFGTAGTRCRLPPYRASPCPSGRSGAVRRGLSTSIWTGNARVVWIDHPSVVHVVGIERERIGPAWNLQRQPGDVAPTSASSAAGTCASQLHAIGAHDPKQRRPFVVRRTEGRHRPRRSRPAIGARRANALPARRRRRLRSVSSRCARRASAARSRASATVDGRRASSTRRAGTARSASSRSARVLLARARLDRRLRFGHLGRERRAIGAGPSRGSSRPSTCSGANAIADRRQRVGDEPTGGWRSDDGFTAGQRMNRRRHADRPFGRRLPGRALVANSFVHCCSFR